MMIRKASPEDSEAIAKIWTQNLGEAPHNFEVSLMSAIEAVRQHILESDTRIVCEKDTIVGFAIASVYRHIDGLRLWISELHVSSGHRGRGAGRALLENFENDYRESGVICIELLSHSASSAVEFYRHLQFECTAFKKFERHLT